MNNNTNETNNKKYEGLAIDNVMDIEMASEAWDISKPHIKLLCQRGEVVAQKMGRIWIIEKDQPNPRKYEKRD